MYIYTTKDGEKLGPFTIYRIKEMIDTGELSPDDLGWHEGLDKWCAVKDIPAVTSTLKSLEKRNPQTEGQPDVTETGERDVRTSLPLPSSVPSEKPATNLTNSKDVKPLLRFWARFFDYLLLNVLVWFVFEHPQIPPIPSETENLFEFLRKLDDSIPREEQIRIALIQGGALFVWNFVEALLISSFGTTPGKMLFNIRVTRKNGTRLRYSEAMGRSVIIWILGIGLGLLFLQILAMAFSLFYLLSKGETLWDRTLKTQVLHRPLSPQGILLAVGAYLVLLSLQTLSLS